MFRQIKKYKKAIFDIGYSFVAYALPTFVLQFAVFPMIAARVGPEENGLFLTLLNVVRLCVSVMILPLTNIRLLKKKECSESIRYERNLNFLFLSVSLLSVVIAVTFSLIYQGKECTLQDIVFLSLVTLLLCAHDYFSIAFRVIIAYKQILIDNILIVLGYAIGILLMQFMINQWEIVFICGYLLGLIFVLSQTHFWRTGLSKTGTMKIIPQYSQLCGSSGLNNITVYCDRMIIYPILGGYAVSVYNAAAIVSKAVALVSVPVRNVLLSYIVDSNGLTVQRKKIRNIVGISMIGAVGLYAFFLVASNILCKLLYPQYFDEALRYVPVILIAVIMETTSSILKILLLRFSDSSVQLIISAIKMAVYLVGIIVLVPFLKLGLWGFCIAILLADSMQLLLAIVFLSKSLKLSHNLQGEI